jgi:cytokinin dehydrogenase
MHRTGAWSQAHPWIETLLPEAALPQLLPQLLEATPSFLGDGHRVALVAERGPSLFMFPKPGPAVAFSVLPMGVPDAFREDALRALRRVHDLGTGAGGKRYLSGWLGMMDEAGWRAHYGDAFDDWVAAKRRFDPHGTLVSALFPRGTTL